eukprot:g6613.t1
MFNFGFGQQDNGFGAFGGGPTRGRGAPRNFTECYRCYSVAMHGKSNSIEMEKGDKIVMPQSAFNALARMNIQYPMLFNLTNAQNSSQKTHCGVLEFSAEEGKCYIPHWMMQNLLLEEGSLIKITNVSLPKATYVKLRPQSIDFVKLHNPKAVLETTLRRFTCLTIGDQICVPHNGRNYYIDVRELRPGNACSIIETDCNVDFEAPIGYKEPQHKQPAAPASKEDSKSPPKAPPAGSILGNGKNKDDSNSKKRNPSYDLAKLAEERAERMRKLSNPGMVVPFSGKGRRVDGKKIPGNREENAVKNNNMMMESSSNNNNDKNKLTSPGLKRDLSKFKKKGKVNIGSVWGDGGRKLV